MKKILRKLMGLGKKGVKRTDFSAFFYDAKAKEEKKVLMKIIKKSNEEQRTIIKKYKELSKAA